MISVSEIEFFRILYFQPSAFGSASATTTNQRHFQNLQEFNSVMDRADREYDYFSHLVSREAIRALKNSTK